MCNQVYGLNSKIHMDELQIKIASPTDADVLAATMKELRPHLNVETFQTELKNQMEEGYELLYIEENEAVIALIGFRTLNLFFSGKTLYIDDLITSEDHQGKGFAGKLMNWIIDFAKKNGYDHLSLDSGFTRKKAHRLYLKLGLEIESLHFGRKTSEL